MTDGEIMAVKYPDKNDCPRAADHTNGPDGYIDWHQWAEKMSETHDCSRCPECRYWVVWTPKKATT